MLNSQKEGKDILSFLDVFYMTGGRQDGNIQRVEHGATAKKYSEKQGGRLEPGTTHLYKPSGPGHLSTCPLVQMLKNLL